MSSTRQATSCPVFGQVQELSRRCLPTYKDVMKHCLFKRQELQTTDKIPPLNCVFDAVSSDLLDLWKMSSIPAVSKNIVIAMLKQCQEKKRNLLKSKDSKKGKAITYNQNLKIFNKDMFRLFDITACKCKEFALCNCSKEKKVPKGERAFITDQRTERRMVIGAVDVASSTRNIKRDLIKMKEE